MNRIIYSNSEGGVSIIIPVPECGLTIEEIAAKDVPQGAAFEIVTTADIPGDRTFRNAWIKGNGRVEIDMPKAQEIAHEKRRAARAEEFKPHDEIIMKQIPGANAQQAEAARQVIRDKYAALQAQMDAAQTPEELKTLVQALQ